MRGWSSQSAATVQALTGAGTAGFLGKLRKRSGLEELEGLRPLSQSIGAVKTRWIDETSLLPNGGLLGLCSSISLSLHGVKC